EAEIVQIELSYSNVFLIKTPRPILIDSGSPGDTEDIREALLAHGAKLEEVALVVLTHGHADHSGGAAAIRSAAPSAKIVLGAGDLRQARRGSNDFMVPTGLMGWLIRPMCDFPFPPFEPDIAVVGSLDLAPWGVSGTVVATPGHTPGALVVLVGKEAFVGDQILGGWLGGALRASSPGEHYYQDLPERNHANIRALLDRGVETFYVGHGGPLSREDVKDEFGATSTGR
ncbi:MAG: MBL fold metallo-hydrolase, partial [Planctomycetota bacterium]